MLLGSFDGPDRRLLMAHRVASGLSWISSANQESAATQSLHAFSV